MPQFEFLHLLLYAQLRTFARLFCGFCRRAGVQHAVQRNHDHEKRAAAEGKGARHAAACERDPHGIEQRLYRGENRAGDRAAPFACQCIKNIRDAELHHAEQRENADGSRVPGILGKRGKRQTDSGAEHMPEEDAAHLLLSPRIADRHKHAAHKRARRDAEQVADEFARIQAVKEEKRDAAEREQHRDNVQRARLLVQEQERKKQDEDRRRVLQDDGICRRGVLIGHDEADEDAAQQNAADQRVAREDDALFCQRHIGKHRQRRKQRAPARNDKAVQIQQSDEYARNAPQHRTDDHLTDADASRLYHFFCVFHRVRSLPFSS